MKATRCKFCGLGLVFDDATRSIMHEVPECAEFKKIVAESNPIQTQVVVFDEDPMKNVPERKP